MYRLLTLLLAVLTIPWNSQTGWGTPKIQPYAPLQLDPSSTVLHYAPTLFEGLKAYKGKDGVPRLFRPDKVRRLGWLERSKEPS